MYIHRSNINMDNRTKGNASEISTIMDYYKIAWSNRNISELISLFEDGIIFDYEALDEPSKKFHLKGRDNVLNKFYGEWAEMSDRSHTQINNFKIDCAEPNTYLISYTNIQKHLVDNHTYNDYDTFATYQFTFVEKFIFGASGSIKSINFIRVSKLQIA